MHDVFVEVDLELGCLLSYAVADPVDARVFTVVEVAPHHVVRTRALDKFERSVMLILVLRGDDPGIFPLASIQRVSLLHHFYLLSVPDRHE